MLSQRTYVITHQYEDGVLLLKYNNPKTGNSLHPTLVAEMVEVMKWANTESSVKVIVLTGEGKFFCTGMDLVDGKDMSFAKGSNFHQLNQLFILSKKILVAAVNGPAVGFGATSLALFDLVFAVPDAYFFTPFVKWGMTTEACSSFTFPRMMGLQKASLLCIKGERITAQEADSLGLISKVLPKDQFLEAVIDIAKEILQSPPGALSTTKNLLREPMLEQLLKVNDRECDAFHKERIPSGEPEAAIRNFGIEQARKRGQISRL